MKTVKWPSLVAVIALITFLAYDSLSENDFVDWDDPQYVTENDAVKGFKIHDLVTGYYAGNYHPLTMLSLALDYSIFGNNPGAFHYINLLLHLANALLVAYLVWELTRGAYDISFWLALFFAIHPQHVESVAWLSERKDVLSTFLFLLGLVIYAKQSAKCTSFIRNPYYYIVLCLFFGALNAKSMVVTFPLILFLFDYINQRKLTILTVLEKIPFFALSLLYGLINIQAQREREYLPSNGYDLLGAMLTALNSLAFYLYKSLFPTNLSILYQRGAVSLAVLEYLVAIAITAGIVISYRVFRNSRRDILFGCLFFLITIAPVTGIIPFGQHQAFADRYMYLPFIGLFYVYALIASSLIKSATKNRQLVTRALIGVLLVTSLVFCLQTNKRVKAWRNTETLLGDVIKKYPLSTVAYTNLGKYYIEKENFGWAIYYYRKVIEINPEDHMAYSNIGAIYLWQHQEDKAMAAFKKASELAPKFVTSAYNLGSLYQKKGMFSEAITEYQKIISLDSSFPDAPNNLGNIYLRQGQIDAAITAYQQAIKAKPDFLFGHLNLANSYRKKGLVAEALHEYQTCLKLDPDNEKVKTAIAKLRAE